MKTISKSTDRLSPRWNPTMIEGYEIGRAHARMKNPIMSGMLEGITQPIYDEYRVALANALPVVPLFTVPIGGQYNQGGVVAFNKTALNTNMVQAGVLPAPNKLIVRAIYQAIAGLPGTNPAPNPLDMQAYLFTTLFDFQVNTKSYSKQNAVAYPAGGGVFASISNNAAAVAAIGIPVNGWPDVRNAYSFAYGGIPIEQQQNFTVILDPTQDTAVYTTAAAAAVPAGTGLRVVVKLDGTLFRAVQ
jgi:hypothetical protein